MKEHTAFDVGATCAKARRLRCVEDGQLFFCYELWPAPIASISNRAVLEIQIPIASASALDLVFISHLHLLAL